MSECMSKLKGKRVIWIGDINLDQNKIKSLDYKKLDLTLKSFNMVQTIQGIIRVAKRGDKYTSTTIDVIMTNCYADFESCCVLGERIGDHQAIKCEIGFSVCKAPQYEKIKIRNHSTANLDSFAYFLNDCDYSPLLECPDVESVALGLQEHLNKYYDEYCPVKSIRKHQNYIFKPSKATLKAIRLKTKLYKKFKRKLKLVEEHRPYCNKCNICTRCHNRNKAWEEYTKQRNLVTKITKVNKRQNIVNDLKAKSTKNDLKGIWKTIKLAANIAPSTNTQDKNVCPLHPEELNQHFSTVGPKLQVEVPVYDHMSYTDFLPQHNRTLCFSEFQEVSSSEIKTYIDTLSADKAIFDTIPIRVYKAILPAKLEPVTHIVNLSLTNGIVPSFCKLAQVSPILKGGDNNDPNNYRPISILPIIGKCIEYFVNKQLTNYMEGNKLLSSQQYGFRKNHSTTYLMLDLFDEVYTV